MFTSSYVAFLPSFTFHLFANAFLILARLHSGVLNYLGPKDLTVYYIKETSFDSFDLPDGSRTVQVQIRLGRRLLGVALTTYLPTVLILIIVHLTHYYKSFYFEAIVTVCLTCEYKFDQVLVEMVTKYLCFTISSLPRKPILPFGPSNVCVNRKGYEH